MVDYGRSNQLSTLNWSPPRKIPPHGASFLIVCDGQWVSRWHFHQRWFIHSIAKVERIGVDVEFSFAFRHAWRNHDGIGSALSAYVHSNSAG